MASAASQQLGLAESQDLPKTDFQEFEDPARCWIDLVTAFKAENPAAVRDVLTQAKASHWTHDNYNEALIEEAENNDRYSDEAPDTQQYESDFYEE